MQLHLLEHAFDMILEAGEIPRHLFFFELVIQAIVQHNYDRAVILINTLAHAPFQVSEKQWTNLFKESEDRMSHENLERLLDALGSCDVVSESTVSNLTKSLHVLCGLDTSRKFSSIIPFGSKDSVNGSGPNERIDDRNAPKFSTRMMIEGAESENDIFIGSYDSATSACTRDGGNEGDNDDVMVFRHQNSDIEDGTSSQADRLECTDNLALEKSSDALDKKLWDDGSSEDDNGEGVTKKATAYEILELWKELRVEDGSLLHSELGRG